MEERQFLLHDYANYKFSKSYYAVFANSWPECSSSLTLQSSIRQSNKYIIAPKVEQ
jgi:hypothetical protein